MVNKNSGDINCPECKMTTNIPNKKVEFLPKNRIAIDLMNQNNKNPNKTFKNELNKLENFIMIFGNLNMISFFNPFELLKNKILRVDDYITKNIHQCILEDKLIEILDSFINIYRFELFSFELKMKEKIRKNFEKFNEKKNKYNNEIKALKDKIEENIKLVNSNTYYEINAGFSEFKEYIENFIRNNNDPDIKVEDLEKILSNFSEMKSLDMLLRNIDFKESNPFNCLFTNHNQNDISINEFRKLLKRGFDYDENISKCNISSQNTLHLNIGDIENEVINCFKNSDSEKIKCIFDHFYLNPNFLEKEKNININNLSISNSRNKNSRKRNNNFNNNQIKLSLNDNNINYRNLYSLLKNFPDGEEKNKLIKYLIEEYNYIPLYDGDKSNIKLIEYNDISYPSFMNGK
jgi:hypothetical protein